MHTPLSLTRTPQVPAVWALGALLWGVPFIARGGTIERTNKERTKLLVSLTQSELVALNEGDQRVIELDGKVPLVTTALIRSINLIKKTAVLELAAAEPSVARHEELRFLSSFWNPVLSPLITSYAQYHQYVRSSLEGGAGGFFANRDESRSDGGSAHTRTVGSRIALNGYILFSPTTFGAGLGYEERSATVTTRSTGLDDDKSSLAINKLVPGAWFEVQPHWRLGVSYDLSFAELRRTSDGVTFHYNLAQPVLGVTRYESDYEAGITYHDKATSTAVATIEDKTGVSSEVDSYLAAPAEVWAYYRNVSSPVLIWGAGFGYVFYERSGGKGQPLKPKARLPENLRAQVSLEHRLDDGAKIDWLLTYDGAQTIGLALSPYEANMGGIDVTYQCPVFDNAVVVGGTLALKGGAAKLAGMSDATDDREEKAYGASVLAFARWEFDLLDHRRPY